MRQVMSETISAFRSEAGDGEQIFHYRWTPAAPPRAVVQIAHGMGEHAARYRRFATALTDAGYVVYANDHRGHGLTAGEPDRLGHLGGPGFAGLVGDMWTFTELIAREHRGLPVVVMGHSMGSMALQRYLLDHSDAIAGAILSGTTAVDVIAAGIDPTQPADLTLFNAPFEPARTPYDWLSRDEAEVDLYVNDAACGFGLDVDAMAGMLALWAEVSDRARLAGIRSDLPVYVASGDADPIAGGGALVQLVADRYHQAGLTDVTLHLYPQARHEILNETNRDEVTADLLAWLDRVTPR